MTEIFAAENPKQQSGEKKTILVLASDPKDERRLRLQEEVRRIGEALRRSGRRDLFELKSELAVRASDFRRALLEHKPSVVHFSGHGDHDGIALEDENGNSKLLGGDAITNLFALFADEIECVVLNSCYAEQQAKNIAQHIEYVIGTVDTIGDADAIAFAEGFYDSIGAGRNYEFAFRFGKNAITMDGLPDDRVHILLKRDQLQETEPPKDPDDSPRKEKIPFNVPFRSKAEEFIGREGKPEEIRAKLCDSGGVAIGQAVGIEGMGGLGKTQLAVEYAHKYRTEYPNGVIWFTADGDMEGQLRLMALENLWVNKFDKPENQLIIARQKIKHLTDALLIFDNVNDYADIEPYLPTPNSNVHILATSRENLIKMKSVELSTLTAKASEKLLVETAERQPETDEDKEALEKILKILDGLPLALEMAGAYLREIGAICSWKEYLDLLEKKPEAAFDEAFIAGSFTGHDAGVYRTLRISDQLLDKTPYLREILDILTWSGSSSMGIPLLSAMLGVSGKPDIMIALAKAVSLRLLKREADADRYSIHRLLSKVRREEIPLPERKEWTGECAERLGKWFTSIKEDFANLSDFESELEHLEAWERNAAEDFPEKAVRLIYLKAYPAFHRGMFRAAEKWTRNAYREYERRGLTERLLLADILNDLGFLTSELGLYKKSVEYSLKALEIRKEALGERHPDYAITLNTVSNPYLISGNNKKALEYLLKAIDIQKEVLGEKDPDYAQSLGNVGTAYRGMGDYQKALEYSLKAIDIQKEVLGEKHPNYAMSLHNMGHIYSNLGNHEKALEYGQRALEIWKEALGEKHPDYVMALNSTGLCYIEMGNHRKALADMQKALDIQREILGEKHPAYAWTLNNMAVTYLKTGDAETARTYFEQAVSIFTATFGPNHPKTLSTKKGLEEARIALGGMEEKMRIQIAKRKHTPKKKRRK